jgi:hypothetical protein
MNDRPAFDTISLMLFICAFLCVALKSPTYRPVSSTSRLRSVGEASLLLWNLNSGLECVGLSPEQQSLINKENRLSKSPN